MATDKQVSFLRHLLRKAGDSAIDTDKLKEMDTDEASELIDELLDTADAQAADNMATDKQVSFLRHLLQKAGDSAIDTGKLKELDKDEASALVDELSDTADVLDAGGWTPLHFAARNNEVSVVLALVKIGADPNARDERGRTPLHFAAFKSNDAVVSALVKAGFDPNARNEKDRMPLHFAVRNNDLAVVSALVEAGFDPNAQNEKGATPLHFAVLMGNAAMVVALIKAGADPNVQNQEGQTPRDLAQRYDDALKGTDAWLLLNEGQS